MPDRRDVHKATEWFKQWGVYRSIVDHDWMCHVPIHEAIHRCILTNHSHPFSLLDLGCGDAGFIRKTFATTQLKLYTGVDASAAALAEARTRLAGAEFSVSLVEADLLGYLANESLVGDGSPQPPDIVMAGYAVHHLSLSDKRRFFAMAHAKLARGGSLVLYDIFRRPEESREQYVASYLAMMKAEWRLAPGDLEGTCRHIEACDFPETEEVILDMARAAGFTTPPQDLFCDARGFHRLFCFRNESTRETALGKG